MHVCPRGCGDFGDHGTPESFGAEEDWDPWHLSSGGCCGVLCPRGGLTSSPTSSRLELHCSEGEGALLGVMVSLAGLCRQGQPWRSLGREIADVEVAC
ncbi:Hypothetical predicted protein [Marmota monax]|uniref:Uncharacterized protein n=1 Tax=Marmota monax TaxID=9995 RepID=A0A5E4CYJ9_MARMO|nr:hypothetical protein GHT09_007728 [Marmota monax]VTJ86149.1 Hypothetical predicted protein [Marmota monax]